MNINNRGTWSAYIPDAWPEGLPANIVFCKSDVDGTDWYMFQREQGLSDQSIKLVLNKDEHDRWIVKVAAIDGSRLFPANSLLLEVYDVDFTDPTIDPQATYGGLMYDATAVALVAAPVIPVIPHSASKLGLKRALDAMGMWDQAKAMIAADPDTQEEWDLAIEIKRTDPLTQKIIKAMNLTDAQVDQLLLAATAAVA